MSRIKEYASLVWPYLKGPFAYVVNFTRNHPKTTLAVFLATHIARGWL